MKNAQEKLSTRHSGWHTLAVNEWHTFGRYLTIRDMVKRGLPIPTLVTTDGAPALIAAVEAIWPHSLRQRCLVHKVRNVLDRVPDATTIMLRAFRLA